MTAIIGFTCHDSILMMADTEESTTEYIIDYCINNAIISTEVRNPYAQTERECRSSGRPA